MDHVTDQELGLAELLASMGKELRLANDRAEASGAATLAWAEATIEVAVEVTTRAKGGIKFAVLGIGAEGGADRGSGRTIRAHVRCVPVGRDPELTVVGKAVEIE